MGTRVGVLLSGCGFLDGAEIHEAVCAMLPLDRAGAEVVSLAPDREQALVVDHYKNHPVREKRNVLVESARIARGNIRDVAKVGPADLDALLLPGGFGAAKNLSTFAEQGDKARADPGVVALLRSMHAAQKPIAALCVAPALLAVVLGREAHPGLSIGDDSDTAKKLEAMGARHKNAEAAGMVVDRKNKIVTTPCYMPATGISEVAEGAEKAVRALLEMA